MNYKKRQLSSYLGSHFWYWNHFFLLSPTVHIYIYIFIFIFIYLFTYLFIYISTLGSHNRLLRVVFDSSALLFFFWISPLLVAHVAFWLRVAFLNVCLSDIFLRLVVNSSCYFFIFYRCTLQLLALTLERALHTFWPPFFFFFPQFRITCDKRRHQ